MESKGSLVEEFDESSYLHTIGSRVKSLRARRGMSRRILAESSAVSERYLAQLESGTGNISILRLRHIAVAMSVSIEDLVCDRAPETSEHTYLQQYIRNAKRTEILRLYRELSKPRNFRRSSIALVGLRGAGKSTIGNKLAEKLNWRFTDLVRTIEQRAGMDVSEIFSLGGQPTYRRFEMECLGQIIERTDPVIIEVGGSLVSEPLAYERLLSSCVTIWLRATPEDHMNRVIAQGDQRPMVGSNHAMEDLKRILNERESLYERAHYTIDTSNVSIRDAIDTCLRFPAVDKIVRPV